MQRQWRSKPSKDVIKFFEESVDIKLYLIHERGPLSFIFLDEIKRKYSVTIGDKISCSCGGGRIDHCVHSIYVLNRIFKLQFTDPLILQIGFSDQELGKMIELRNQNSLEKNDIKNRKYKNLEEDSNLDKKEHRMNLYEDQTCPICQDDMYNLEGLFYCSKSCGHNFHLNCLKVWAEHKKMSCDLISCPMCRAEWDEDEIKKMVIKHMSDKKGNLVKILPHRGINCKVCSRINIKAERLHCLNCPDFDLCIECFNLNKHDANHSFVMKKKPDDKWFGIEIMANTFGIKNIKFSQFLISLLKDYDKNINSNIEVEMNNDTNRNLEYYSNLDVNNDYESDLNLVNNEDLINNQISNDQNSNKCNVCKSNRASSLQLLKFKILPNCKHLVHFKCAENLFKILNDVGNNKTNNNIFQVDPNFNLCKFDKLEIFPGLTSLNFKLISNTDVNNTTNKTNTHSNPVNNLNSKEIYQNNKNIQNLTNALKNMKTDKLDDFLIIKSLKNRENIDINNKFDINMISNNVIPKSKSITPLHNLNRNKRNLILNSINQIHTNIHLGKHNYQSNDLALNIENMNIVTNLNDLDIFTQKENENKNRIKNMRKLYNIRPPKLDKKIAHAPIISKNSNEINLMIQNSSNSYNKAYYHQNNNKDETQNEKLKNFQTLKIINSKGVKSVDLKIRELKVKL